MKAGDRFEITNEGVYAHIGAKIRYQRQKAKIDQEMLADYLGLSRASVVNIEGGRQRPMIHTILKICSLLHCQPSDLLPSVEYIDYSFETEEKPVTVIKKVRSLKIKQSADDKEKD